MTNKIYCADVAHGGVAVLLCGVDEMIDFYVQRTISEPGYKISLELDAYTFEDWLRDPSPVVDALKAAIRRSSGNWGTNICFCVRVGRFGANTSAMPVTPFSGRAPTAVRFPPCRSTTLCTLVMYRTRSRGSNRGSNATARRGVANR